jgi:FixJ family two-component response regulator
LTAAKSSLPVIIVSGRDNESIHEFVHGLGAEMFLRKPVDDQALLDAIYWVTKRRSDR